MGNQMEFRKDSEALLAAGLAQVLAGGWELGCGYLTLLSGWGVEKRWLLMMENREGEGQRNMNEERGKARALESTVYNESMTEDD